MSVQIRSTMDLLTQALQQNATGTYWCERLGLSKNAISVAKARGRLSPTVAGNLARLLGEEETDWIALAALEAEPDSKGRTLLLNRYRSTKKLYVANKQRGRSIKALAHARKGKH